MDKLIIERKLESLRRCIKRVEQKRPATVEILEADADLQDIMVLNLSRAVQLCVDIGAHLLVDHEVAPPNTMGETFDRLVQVKIIDSVLADRLKKSVGFRNLAVHNYDVLNWHIVFAIAHRHLDDFTAFARATQNQLS